jgi:hypothetical protein
VIIGGLWISLVKTTPPKVTSCKVFIFNDLLDLFYSNSSF